MDKIIKECCQEYFQIWMKRLSQWIFTFSKGSFQSPSVYHHAEHFSARMLHSVTATPPNHSCHQTFVISFVKFVSASPIFRSVVSLPHCSIPTIRLIITNKSNQRGSWELDSLHSSTPHPRSPNPTAANSVRNSHWSAGGYGAMGFLSVWN